MKRLEAVKAVPRLYRALLIARNSYERRKTLAEKTTGTFSEIKVQSNNVENTMECRFVEMIAEKEAYEKAAHAYNEALTTANSIIFSLENPEEMELVYRRYIEGETWKTISYEMGISERKCYMLNRKVCTELSQD